jgi:threonylcarbamoyladenosine tRNA methylthiotransferase MtaB
MKTYRIITLGCKVNQCESAAMGHLLEAHGWKRTSKVELPDVLVVNTCTVTSKAAMQSRQAIRQAIRNHPDAKVVVTGCYAQTAADEVRVIEGVDQIIGHSDKMRIADLLSMCAPGGCLTGQTASPHDQAIFPAMPAVADQARTRAFLKIQDGCNTRCTYCIVPHARGRSRSMPPEDVRAHLSRLGAAGLREVVLTGIHLGAYGMDLDPSTHLTALLTSLVDTPSVDRIRISSIEPTEIDSRMVPLINHPDRLICRHFHIPLQSGANKLLQRMGRPYDREFFKQTIEEIHHHIRDVAIGVDVIAGFPGESEEDFMQTYGLIESLPVSYLHVFPFSPRKGTPAAAFRDKVPQKVTKERSHRLRDLGEKKRSAFHRSMIGRTLTVLIEKVDQSTGYASGLSDNYVQVFIPGINVKENSLVTVHIESIDQDGTVHGHRV